MKLIRSLRMARRMTLMDLQNMTGINAGTLGLFENGRLDLTGEQKSKLHAIFPKQEKENIFADFDLSDKSKSLFTPKLTASQSADLDVEAKKSVRRSLERKGSLTLKGAQQDGAPGGEQRAGRHLGTGGEYPLYDRRHCASCP